MAHFERPEVDTAALRECFERSGLSKGEVCRRLGWVKPNVDRLNRALGYRPDSDSRGRPRPSPRQRLGYSLALRVARALGVDPVDAGL